MSDAAADSHGKACAREIPGGGGGRWRGREVVVVGGGVLGSGSGAPADLVLLRADKSVIAALAALIGWRISLQGEEVLT